MLTCTYDQILRKSNQLASDSVPPPSRLSRLLRGGRLQACKRHLATATAAGTAVGTAAGTAAAGTAAVLTAAATFSVPAAWALLVTWRAARRAAKGLVGPAADGRRLRP